MNEKLIEKMIELAKKVNLSDKKINSLEQDFKKYKEEVPDEDKAFYMKKMLAKVKMYTIRNGYWYFEGENTGIKAEAIDGKDGINGTNGKDGKDGRNGVDGLNGRNGIDGKNGKDGKNGLNGADGLTPKFEVVETKTITSSEEAEVEMIKENNKYKLKFKLPRGSVGHNGPTGKSAYDVWLDMGNNGTEQDYLDSLTDGSKANTIEITAARKGEATLEDKIDLIDTNIDILQNMQVNVKDFGAIGNGIIDDTIAIQTALNSLTTGGTLYFPKGTYIHTGITIPAHYISLLGNGRFSTFLKNTSTNNAITIDTNSERGSIKEIGILGNGTSIYGGNATSGHGIVFSNNSVSWNFENITVRGHGKDGFHGGEIGHVNNINIVNSEIEFNKGNAIYFVAKAGVSQINAININGCNISNNGTSGLVLWGNNINIKENTIQGNRLYGYNISSDLVQGTGTLSCDMISIKNNYSEGNLFGLLNIKIDKISSPLTYKYIGTLIFEENFGHENSLDASITSIITISKGTGISTLFDRAFKCFRYNKNSLSSSVSGVKIFNGNNLLDFNSIIEMTFNEQSNFINYGYSQFIIKQKIIVLNNFLESKGLTFTDISTGKSPNITSNTSIYYPLKIENYNGIYEFGIPIDTDYTNPQVLINLYGRLKGSSAAYTLIYSKYLVTITNGVISAIASGFSPISGYEDMYMKITIYPTGGGGTGTYLYIYNPYLTFD